MPYGILVRNGTATVLNEREPVLQLYREFTTTATVISYGTRQHSPTKLLQNSLLFCKLLPGQGFAARTGEIYYHTETTATWREVCFASSLPADARQGVGINVVDGNNNLVYSSKYPLVLPSTQQFYFKGYNGNEWASPPAGYDSTDEWYVQTTNGQGSRGFNFSTYRNFGYGIRRSSSTRVDYIRFDFNEFSVAPGAPVFCSPITFWSSP